MSAIELTIDRVGISLDGVSQEIAAAAMSGLEGELARRLDPLALRAAVFTRTDLAEIALGPLTAPANIDAEGLRALIADALIGRVLDIAPAEPQADEAQAETSETP